MLDLDGAERPGVRVDSGLFAGTVVGSDYDPMLAKVIAHGDDRAAALRGLDRALADTAVLGVVTNIEFLRFLLADDDVVAGRLDTGLLDRRVGDFAPAGADDVEFVAAAAYRWLQRWQAPAGDLWAVPSGWRIGAHARDGRSGCAPASAPTTSASPGRPDAADGRVEDGETRSLTAESRR